MNEKNPLRVGFPGFEGLIALDLVGPIDAFTSAFVKGRNGEMSNCYEVVIIGLSGQRSLLNPALCLSRIRPSGTRRRWIRSSFLAEKDCEFSRPILPHVYPDGGFYATPIRLGRV